MIEENQPFEVIKSDSKTIKLEKGLLVPGGGNIIIQGTKISSLTDGLITGIEIKKINGVIYKYEILVVGRAEAIHSWQTSYTDLTSDKYNLMIESPIVENHYVDYNSSEPEIHKIKLKLG